MTDLDRYIESLVRGEPVGIDSFPKNESSREELFILGERLITDIVVLKRDIAVLRAKARRALNFAANGANEYNVQFSADAKIGVYEWTLIEIAEDTQ